MSDILLPPPPIKSKFNLPFGKGKLISWQTVTLVIVAIIVNAVAWGTKSKPFNFQSVLSFILITMFFAYNTNCLSVGNCNMWAWIQVLVPVLMLLSAGLVAGTMGLGTTYTVSSNKPADNN